MMNFLIKMFSKSKILLPDNLTSSYPYGGYINGKWITSLNNLVKHHNTNFSFGEDYIYQRNNEWDVPYTFSGKEKDSETGYSYFGARYYDSDLSVWLSVDPLDFLYPNSSPYMYVLGNPIMLQDPDGRRVKGAGFFRNLFKSDNRIKAENRKAELKTQGIDAEISKNKDGWDVNYEVKNDWPTDLEKVGTSLSGNVTEHFYRKKVKSNSKKWWNIGRWQLFGRGDRDFHLGERGSPKQNVDLNHLFDFDQPEPIYIFRWGSNGEQSEKVEKEDTNGWLIDGDSLIPGIIVGLDGKNEDTIFVINKRFHKPIYRNGKVHNDTIRLFEDFPNYPNN